MENLKIRTYGKLNLLIIKELRRLGLGQDSDIKHSSLLIAKYIETRNSMSKNVQIGYDITESDFLDSDNKEVTLFDLQAMETPVVFEVKEDCKSCEFDTTRIYNHFCDLDKHEPINCHNCKDYEKKKEVVKYFAKVNKDQGGLSKDVYLISENSSYDERAFIDFKVCKETNRIYIER